MSKMSFKNANLGLFDLFGTSPTFKIQGQKKHYSLCGLFLTVVVCGFVIWALILTSGDLVDKTNPTIVASELPGAVFNQTLVLTPENFQVKVGLYDILTGALYTDATIYHVNVRLINLLADNPADQFITLDLELCQSDLITSTYLYWCISANQSKVQELYLASEVLVQIDFVRCNNHTTPGACATSDDINAKLKYSLVQMEYLKWNVDPSDYNNPLKSYYVNEQQGVLVSFHKIINVFMKKLSFVSDNGWMVESLKSQSVVYRDSSVIDIQEASTAASFFTYSFLPSGDEVNYSRKYRKLQDILAQVSGLAGTFILIIGLLGRPFDEFKMYEKVINTMYDIRVSQSGKNIPPKQDKQEVDSIKQKRTPKEPPILHLRASSEGYLPKKQSFDRILTTINRDRHSSNETPPDSNRPKRVIDVPKERKLSGGIVKRVVSFPQIADWDASQKEDEVQEELEVIVHENPEIREIEMIKPTINSASESPETDPNSSPNRYGQLDSDRILISPMQMSIKKDIKLDRLKEISITEDSVHKEDTDGGKEEKDYIETVMEQFENNSPTPRGRGILRQTTIQSPSQNYIETDGNLVRQTSQADENKPTKAPPEEPSEKLNISYLEWLISFIRPTKKMKIFNRGMEELMKHMDIILLVRKLAEVDKLKACLLTTREQRVIFDNLRKPKLYVDWNEYKRKSEAREKNPLSDARETERVSPIEAYRALRSLNSQSMLDIRLASLFEKGAGKELKNT